MRGIDWQAIRAQYPLVEIVGEVANLRRAGREWKACCPLHNEKSASFTIYDDENRWHCFGCGKGGDVLDFVAQYEGTDVAGAVAYLTGGAAPRLTDEDRAARDTQMQERMQREKAVQRHAIQEARKRWERATPIDGHNGYLERKGVAPHGCRAEGENLLVPVYDAEGEIQSVQRISPDGKEKRFHTDAPMSGGRMWIGINFDGAILCEGFATGASIYEATVKQVIVCFSKDGMKQRAREMAEAGLVVMLAADTNAIDDMVPLGAELGVPVLVPPMGLPDGGTDFNDQQKHQGIDAVRATIAQCMLEFAQRPEPPAVAPFCSIAFVEAFDFDETAIPLRPWIVPGAILAGSTHILAAPGGTGKSLFTLQLALMLATGKAWGKWVPKRACNVLIVNAEDDVDEQRRRLSAARTVMDIDAARLAGRILIADNPSSILMAANDPKSSAPIATPLVREMADTIRHHGIDVVIVDPFAETFDGDENSNGDTKWAMKIWRDEIARATGAAVYLVHHTTKGASDKAGSADVIRGGGAIVNSARIASTLFGMTEGEASATGVRPEDRIRYVRYDDAKANNSLASGRMWFEKISVVIQNGAGGDSQGGDEVGALKPWEPSPQILPAYAPADILTLLGKVNDGYVNPDGECLEQPFIRQMKGPRWIGYLISTHLGIDNKEAKVVLDQLLEASILCEYEYRDEMKAADRKGLKVDMERANGLLVSPPV